MHGVTVKRKECSLNCQSTSKAINPEEFGFMSAYKNPTKKLKTISKKITPCCSTHLGPGRGVKDSHSSLLESKK